jgi:hypothetical protein
MRSSIKLPACPEKGSGMKEDDRRELDIDFFG